MTNDGPLATLNNAGKRTSICSRWYTIINAVDKYWPGAFLPVDIRGMDMPLHVGAVEVDGCANRKVIE
jgi:hypothetical protein